MLGKRSCCMVAWAGAGCQGDAGGHEAHRRGAAVGKQQRQHVLPLLRLRQLQLRAAVDGASVAAQVEARLAAVRFPAARNNVRPKRSEPV